MSYSLYILELSNDKFGVPICDPRETSDGCEIRYNCPYCLSVKGSKDSKGHLYANLSTGQYYCHRCGSKGSVLGRGNNGSYKSNIYDGVDSTDLINELSSVSKLGDTYYSIPSMKASEFLYSRKYLESRGLSISMMDYYSMRVGSMYSEYFGRIVIPNRVINNNTTDMFVARTYCNDDRRYYNPEGENKSKIVFNLFRIQEGSVIHICEGVFSAIFAGKNAVATYGKYVSDNQVSQILEKKPAEIIISLDDDAIDQAYELANRISSRYLGKIKVVNLPVGQDPADLGTETYLSIVNSTDYYNGLVYSINNYISNF